MTWVLGWLYLRQSDRVFDPLAKRGRASAALDTPEVRSRRRPDSPAALEADGHRRPR